MAQFSQHFFAYKVIHKTVPPRERLQHTLPTNTEIAYNSLSTSFGLQRQIYCPPVHSAGSKAHRRFHQYITTKVLTSNWNTMQVQACAKEKQWVVCF